MIPAPMHSWEIPRGAAGLPESPRGSLRGPQNLPKNASRLPEPPQDCFAPPKNSLKNASRPPDPSRIASRTTAVYLSAPLLSICVALNALLERGDIDQVDLKTRTQE